MPGLQPGVAQVVHDDLRHGQVIFDNKNSCVHPLSLRTPGGHKARNALIFNFMEHISADCHICAYTARRGRENRPVNHPELGFCGL
jgi:hypothetical protein